MVAEAMARNWTNMRISRYTIDLQEALPRKRFLVVLWVASAIVGAIILVLKFSASPRKIEIAGSRAGHDRHGENLVVRVSPRALASHGGAMEELCNATQEELKPCNTQRCHGDVEPVDCLWGSWSSWSKCDCTATQQRHRNITQQPKHGGMLCVGPEVQAQSCAAPACGKVWRIDCQLGDWEAWSACTRTCQGGQMYRTRDVVRQMEDGGALCKGNLHETRVCSPEDCPDAGRVDCQWETWSDWSTCSTKCGAGQTSRSRAVATAPKYGGKLCDPVITSEVKQCPMSPSCNETSFDCKWADWSVWSSCSKTCGGGTRFRVRSIAREVQEGGAGCEGNFEDYAQCGTQVCNVTKQGQDCYLGMWSNWTLCSAKCNGHRSRVRMIERPNHDGGEPCHGSTMDIEPCNTDRKGCLKANKDCMLKDWGDWSVCSRSCEGGTQSQKRGIAQHASGLGKQCSADLHRVRQCSSQPCPGQVPVDCTWGAWSMWSSCTKSCGGGEHRRHRAVDRDAAFGGKPCDDGAAIEIGTCESQDCPSVVSNCEWADWSAWSSCLRDGKTVTCDGGQRSRTRGSLLVDETVKTETDVADVLASSIGGASLVAGKVSKDTATKKNEKNPAGSNRRLAAASHSSSMVCREVADEVEPCAQHQCGEVKAQDCVWGAWSQWSACPCSAIQERHRVIASYAMGGGKPCEGSEVQANPCHSECASGPAVDCEMSPWTPWSGCPVTCGGGEGQGFIRRFRVVTQFPRSSGKPCEGAKFEKRACNPDPCPEAQDCRWGAWTTWSACSEECGGGERSRTRNIDAVAKNGGKQCDIGDSMVVEVCNMQICPSRARDCEFSAWNDWATCTATCGSGHQHRSRMVMVQATAGGIDCDGFLQEFRRCHREDCPGQPKIDCKWGSWSQWSACSELCNGHAERNRAIVEFAARGGTPCSGPERDIKACNLGTPTCDKDAPLDCELGAWADWTLCSKPCDGGQKYRSRRIKRPGKNFGKPCEGSLQISQPCGTGACPGDTRVDCKWGDWGAWSGCSKTCFGGQRVRHREVAVEPSPEGLPCDSGAAMQTSGCSTGPCQHLSEICGWAAWSLWGPCSKDCGGGQQERFRQQQWVHVGSSSSGTSSGSRNSGNPTPSRSLLASFRADVRDKGDCDGSQKAVRPCGVAPCHSADAPQPCQWEDWSDWTDCSCNGVRERSRNIAAPPKNGGMPCNGPITTNEKCTPSRCGWQSSVDCKFSAWSDWSECDSTCGGGQRYHTRSISTHSEAYGFGCHGGLEEVSECNTQSCGEPVDCQYSAWSRWTQCSQTCGGGERSRSRSVEVAAAFGGADCQDAALLEIGECGTDLCSETVPVDCRWTSWLPWHPCPVTCGNATTWRTRDVANRAMHGGMPCQGYFEQYHTCNIMPCVEEVVDCNFADWSQWSSCSSRCGGQQERSRNIALYARGSGKACQGPSRQLRPCDGAGSTVCKNEAGPRDCSLSDWTQWSACTHSCGGGQQLASRTVAVQSVGTGKPCGEASLRKVRPCSDAPCPGKEPVDCAWADWGPPSRCSATCGGGEVYRRRSVASHPKFGGKPCTASDTLHVIPCATEPCRRSSMCTWSSWSLWDSCSAACDGGEKKRHRHLANPTGLTSMSSSGQKDDSSSEIAADWSLLRGTSTLASPSDRVASVTASAPALFVQFLALASIGASTVAFGNWVLRRREGSNVFARQPRTTSRADASYAPVPSEEPFLDTPAE